MKGNLYDYADFVKALQNKKLVYLLGAGISSALTENKSCGWWKWIYNGTHYMKDHAVAARLRKSMEDDSSTDNLINVVGEVIKWTKDDGTYERSLGTGICGFFGVPGGIL